MCEIHVFCGIRDFDLMQTFECGQCFRWEAEDDGSYTGTAADKYANIRIEGERLTVEGKGSREFWSNYLDLEADYGKMKKRLEEGEPKIMPLAAEKGAGIRILRQELWETLVHFIISQNNNIPRIKGCIEKLSAMHGEYIGDFRGKSRYSVPRPEKLASLTPEDLKEARLGYRDRYLIETAAEWLKRDGTERLRIADFHGVGPKVEACIRLFGLHDMAAFPIDVWVKRLMNRFYGFREGDREGMKRFAVEHFGELAGLAQQYLFYYIRCLDRGTEVK